MMFLYSNFLTKFLIPGATKCQRRCCFVSNIATNSRQPNKPANTDFFSPSALFITEFSPQPKQSFFEPHSSS